MLDYCGRVDGVMFSHCSVGSPSGAAVVPDFPAEPRVDDGWPQRQWQVHCLAGPDEGSGEAGGHGRSGQRD